MLSQEAIFNLDRHVKANPSWNEETETLIGLFDHALDITPLRELEGMPLRINKALESLSNFDILQCSDLIKQLNEIEPFGKHIMSFVCPETLGNVNNASLRTVLVDGLKLIKPEINLSSVKPERFSTPEYYYIEAYQSRNAEFHVAPVSSPEKAISTIRSILCTYLMICKKYKYQIMSQYTQTLIHNSIDLSKYAKAIREAYKPMKEAYVPLSWLIPSEKESVNNTVNSDSIIMNPAHQLRITGQAGSGKTFFLKNIEYRLAQKLLQNSANSIVLPVFIKLIDISSPANTSLTDMFAERLKLSQSLAKEIIAAPCIVLLLDGFDEISDPGIRRSVAFQVDMLLEEGAQVLITDRGSGSSILSRKLKDCLPQKLIPSDYSAFVSKYALSETIKAELNRIVSETGAFPVPLKTPLQIKQYIEMCEYSGQAVYADGPFTDSYIEYLIGREYQEKKDFNAEPLKVLLCGLSLENGAPWQKIRIQKIFADWKTKLGYVNTDTIACFQLALELGFLKSTGNDCYNFSSVEFEVAFQGISEKLGLLEL